jgi:TusA-related sulfurtransferase/rhodanese-related sulfurtransferase
VINLEKTVQMKDGRNVRRKMVFKTLKLLFWSLTSKLMLRRGFYLPRIPEITVEKLHERLNSDEEPPLLIDLRDEEELEKDGYIENSKMFSYFNFPSYIDELPRDQEIITMCPGGGASLVGAEILINAGFSKKNVKSLKGGVRKWKKKGYPLIDFERSIESKSMTIEERIPALKGKEFSKIDETVEVDISLNVRDLLCPGPVLESRKAIKKMEIGQVLEILTTDPGSLRDIPSWAINTKQEFISYQDLGDEKGYSFLVRRLK